MLSTKPPKCPQCKRRMADSRRRLHDECVEPWIACQLAKQEQAKRKKAEAAKRQERQQTMAQKEAGKGLRKLLSEAQDAFNEWIRLRDADQHCIACGDPFEPNKPGGSMDAGHFRARSVAPQLRFHEANVFGQHKDCNRPGGTVYADFRAGVIARVGLPTVEDLEANNTVKKWTRDEVRGIRDTYRARVRELKKERAAA